MDQPRSITVGRLTDSWTKQVIKVVHIIAKKSRVIKPYYLDNASCELPIKTNNCEVQLLHYFSSPGQYILPVVLYNQVFYQVIPLKVNIYEGIRLFC